MSAPQEMLLGATALERDLDLEIERWVREIETREPQAYLGTYEFCICICIGVLLVILVHATIREHDHECSP